MSLYYIYNLYFINKDYLAHVLVSSSHEPFVG